MLSTYLFACGSDDQALDTKDLIIAVAAKLVNVATSSDVVAQGASCLQTLCVHSSSEVGATSVARRIVDLSAS